MPQDIPKITVGLPSNGYIRTETTVCLVSAIANTRGVFFRLSNPTGCYIHQNRENIVLEAQKEKSTHVMFIDSDMTFPPDGIARLISLNKHIVGANYNHRDNSGKSVIRVDPRQHKKDIKFGDKTATIDDPEKPFKCLALGTGFMLIKLSVFDKLPKPWFFFEPSSSPNGMTGEDIWFCNLARNNGVGIWCDPTIPVGHIGIAYY